jgi:hypothetical protein
VGVFVHLRFVALVDMIVRAVVVRVLVVMNQDVSMVMPVFVLVAMLMAMLM